MATKKPTKRAMAAYLRKAGWQGWWSAHWTPNGSAYKLAFAYTLQLRREAQ